MATKPHRSAAAQTIKPKAAPHGLSEVQDKPAKGKTATAAAKPPAKKTAKTAKTAAGRKPGGAAVSKAKPISGRPDVDVFIAEYIVDRNGTRAAIAAGYSPKTAKAQACRLLTTVYVKQQVNSQREKFLAKVQADTGITLERTLREIARVAFFDVRRLFNVRGEPLPLTELDDDTAAAIAGLDVLEAFEGAGEDRRKVGDIKKWKLADKLGGLDKLMKHLDGYNADNRGRGEPLAEALAGFVSQIHQSGAGRLKFVPRSKA